MIVFLYIVACIWFFILFLDTIFKTCLLQPYFQVLYTAGVEIYPLLFVWTITRYNRFINRMGLHERDLVKIWFCIGSVVTCIAFFPCFFFYVYKLVSLFYTDTVEEFESSIIVPVVPAFNFPLSQWHVYFCVIFICSAFHEFGHALAASRLGIPLDSFGFAVLFVAPIAFVDVRLDQLRRCSLWKQMTVFCAGIWHNIILSLTCMFILKNLSLFLMPLFYVGGGITVIQVNEQSGLNQPTFGFIPGDHIHTVGDCAVKDLESWNRCLTKLEDISEGLCVPNSVLSYFSTYLHFNNTDVLLDGCAKIPGHLFFYSHADVSKPGVCLAVRAAVETYSSCTFTSDCDESSVCLIPLLPKSHKLIVFKRLENPSILFDGSISELVTNVKVSEYLPIFGFLSSSNAEAVKEFIAYIVIFSNGLACLNMLPIFGFDGVYIAETLIHIFVLKYFRRCRRFYSRYSQDCIHAFAIVVTTTLFFITFYKLYIFYA